MKTIFFSLSFENVYKNLFFFSGSAFFRLGEALKGRDDVQIVFLLPASYEESFRPFIEEKFGANRKIELIHYPYAKKRSFFQKLFYFFYAHFIFTGTTFMLTTMGMRPGEPPGGGRIYLMPLKFLIANTFGRLKFMRDKIIPEIFYRSYSKGIFEDAFEKYKPDLVFAPHLFGQFDQALVAEANKRKILTLGMISNWDHFDKYYIPVQTDKLLAQSEQIKDFAMRYQNYRAEQIFLTGYPQFDFLGNADYAVSREEVLDKYDFAPGAKYIYYISGSAYCPDEPDVIEKILRWIKEGKLDPGVKLVIRPYIGGRGADQNFDMKKYNSFRSNPSVVFFEETLDNGQKMADYFNLMRHADIVIAVYSTALIEAGVFNRPLVITNFDGYKKRPFFRSVRRFGLREHFKKIIETGGVRKTENFEELFEALSGYLKNPNLDEEKREVLRKEACFQTDNLASKRVVDAIMKYAGLN